MAGQACEWRLHRYEEAKLAYKALMEFYPFTLSDLEGEEWKTIPSYTGYQVSNFGRVKSFKRYRQGKIKVPSINSDGYLTVCLNQDGNQKNIPVHRLVAKLFVANPDNLPQVDHRFGMKFDNYAENLRWVTCAENIQSAWEMGLAQTARGGKDSQAKLTNEQAQYVRDNPDKLTRKQLADLFGVNYRTIGHIQRRETYKEI